MSSSRWFGLAVIVCTLFPVAARSENVDRAAVLQPGSLIEVQLDRDVKMAVGRTVSARTVYPLYINNQLVLPRGTEVWGIITGVHPAPGKVRRNARFHGDFTPLREAQVLFDSLTLGDGTRIAIGAAPASDAVQVVHFESSSAAAHHESLPHRLWSGAMERKNTAVSTFTAPGKWERVRKALYAELPVHPQGLSAGLEYKLELTRPVSVPLVERPPQPAAKNGEALKTPVLLSAELLTAIDSKTAAQGAPVKAVVTQPLLDPHHRLQVPQGTLLLGEVTQVKPAGKWGKGGVLRFAFHEMQFPAGQRQPVHGSTVAVDADQRSNLQIDAEGGAKPQRNSIVVPLAMGALAGSALHEDETVSVTTAGASNGFALVGRVVALSCGSHYVGAAMGLLATGRSLYSRFLAHGADVSFARDTRVEIAVDPVRSPLMHLNPQ